MYLYRRTASRDPRTFCSGEHPPCAVQPADVGAAQLPQLGKPRPPLVCRDQSLVCESPEDVGLGRGGMQARRRGCTCMKVPSMHGSRGPFRKIDLT